MSLCARSVRLASPPAVLAIAAFTTMLPSPVPALPVTSATLAPTLSCAVITSAPIVVPASVDTMAPSSTVAPPPPPATTSRLDGSISHWPPCPTVGAFFTSSDWWPEVSTKPPGPALPVAETRPSMCAALSASRTIWPPEVPSAWMAERDVVWRSVARRNTRPPSLTALLALISPALVTRPAARPMRPASATMRPTFVTSPFAPLSVIETPGCPVSTSCTFCPAASNTSPREACSVPVFSTFWPTR